MVLSEEIESCIEEVGVRLIPRDALKLLHALFVGDTLRFELVDQIGLTLPDLRLQQGTRILEDRLDTGDHVERVVRRVRVEGGDRVH